MGYLVGKKVRMLRKDMPAIWCPACKYAHPFPMDDSNVVEGKVHKWTFNGDGDAPTFAPSMNIIGRCHSTVTNGKIQFHGDCKHSMAGQIVDVPDWPTEEGAEYDYD